MKKSALLTLIAALPALCLVMLTGGSASAHGAPMDPGSRTFLCWQHARDASGAMNPTNPACRAALNTSGANGFYNWFAVLQSNGQGRTAGFIPDGQLCSGASGAYDFSGFDLARDDWPYTHLTAGARWNFSYNVWAHHPGTFHLYVTKDGYNPNRPLTWADMESTPFHSVTDPPWRGSVGTAEAEYYWTANLPANKSGRHIIYMVWDRSDSPETFYSCSDVVFDGGNGEVTIPGVGSGPGGPGGPGDPGDPGDPGEPGDPVNPVCTATHGSVNTWSGGYQAEVTVTNTGDRAISSWTADWSLPAGGSLVQAWGASAEAHGSHVVARNAAWNGSLAPGASATFGYIADGTAPSSGVTISCAGT